MRHPIWSLALLFSTVYSELITVPYSDNSLAYSGIWLPPNNFGGSCVDHGNRMNNVSGASVQFSFKGVSVRANFYTDHVGSVALIYVDGTIAAVVNTIQPNVIAYDRCNLITGSSGSLTDAVHNVTMVNGAAPFSDNSITPIYFISFEYMSSTSTTTSGTTASTGVPVRSSARSSARIGGAVGGAVGGLVLLVFIGVVINLRRKRRQKQNEISGNDDIPPMAVMADNNDKSPVSFIPPLVNSRPGLSHNQDQLQLILGLLERNVPGPEVASVIRSMGPSNK